MSARSMMMSLDVEVGRSYVTDRATPLMPHHSPSNEFLAIARMETIEPGEVFEVVDRHDKRGYPWFKVRGGSREGWVSGIALVGQELRDEGPLSDANESVDDGR